MTSLGCGLHKVIPVFVTRKLNKSEIKRKLKMIGIIRVGTVKALKVAATEANLSLE